MNDQQSTDTRTGAASTFAQLVQEAMKVLSAPFGHLSTQAPTMPNVTLDPNQLSALQADYLQRLSALGISGSDGPKPADRRFSSSAWQQGPLAWNAAIYELNAETINKLSQSLTGDTKSVQRMQFAMSQMVDAMSPANFLATNPHAQDAALKSQGASLQAGMQNFIDDLMRGSISQTDDTAFTVGENLAVTPGSVVYENELIQLIQYAPSTESVGNRPMLMIPPCINKYYILDLQPENSVVAWLVAQGHTVFMVSWRNVNADQGHLNWDNYLESGVVNAIDAVRSICKIKTINALGFCVGGTIIATTLAALAAKGERPVKSLTLLTSLLDFEDTGVLDIFIDEAQVQSRESTIGNGGLLTGAELATTFSSLRPNDLIWNYVSRNYLQGEKPPAFDLLYWNSDSTNLPGPAFVWYLRHMYLQNELKQAGALTCLDQPIDLGKIELPTFIYGSREDHIVPWQAAYKSRALLGERTEFVLGASGHIAGVINPPSKNKRHYWIGSNDSVDADAWFETAQQCEGSWWPHWAEWLDSYKGRTIPARSKLGSKRHPIVEPAPGRYVKQPA